MGLELHPFPDGGNINQTVIIMPSNNRDNTLNSCHSMEGTNHRLR